MKKILLFIGFAVLTMSVNAQVILSGESPASIQGNYDLSYATQDDGWGVPDMLDPANAIIDTLAKAYDDGSYVDDEGDPVADSASCTDVVSDVDGKIAVLYRGSCQFGLKALNAQNAGAVGVIIINNEPGALIGMLGGDDGPSVTIPVILISDVDGETLTSEMQNEDVVVFIGNKTGFYPNDLGALPRSILRPKQFATPSMIAQDDTEFNFELGAWVYNYGFQDQTSVTLSATVDYDGTLLYNDSAAAVDIPAGDSAFFSLPEFSETSYNEGYYDLTYTIASDSADDAEFDNSVSAEFNINGDYMFTYATLNDTSGLPTSSGVGYPSTSESCMVFKDDNASRLIPTAVTFSAFKGPDADIESLEGDPIVITVSEWNDQFTNINDATYEEVNQVAFTEYEYPADLPGEPVTATIEPFAMEDGKRYLFCVSSYDDNLFIMYDGRIDYTENVNTYLEPFTTVKDAQGNYFAAGFGTDATPAIGIHMVDAQFLNVKEETSYNMNVYPNPAADKITVDFNGYEANGIEVLNLAGQSVISKAVGKGQMNTVLDVDELDNGLYILKVLLSDGMVSTMNVVVSH